MGRAVSPPSRGGEFSRPYAFYFATNPAGALVDGLLFANGQSNMNSDAVWNVRTRRTAEGWSAEFAIPFKSLSFPSGRTTWGFNIARTIQRKLEEDRWILKPGNDLFFVFSQGWVRDPEEGYGFRPQESKVSAKLQ